MEPSSSLKGDSDRFLMPLQALALFPHCATGRGLRHSADHSSLTALGRAAPLRAPSG
ncbi:hypothetical protein FHS33_001440 [Streptomyces calvus]|jgi:hypothetical protein|uniref:Uncharacterized protein n=1 Tax=Streptomyces calvus TaxID=67282 RepID=A0AA40SAS4_9ACTN|nr:hypothetical protein [Streptomyces calvus]GGP34830.1 hypothetical protein GCM10010247_03140 [Streptomyces calvus]